MRLDWSDDDNVRIMVEQFGFTELRARFAVDMGRGRIDGDIEVVDGPLTGEDKRRLGIGSIFEAVANDCAGGGGDDGGGGGGLMLIIEVAP